MKCSNCQEIWFQFPEDETIDEEGFERPPVEDIPHGVKPLQENSNLPVIHDDEPQFANPKARIAGYGAAACVFFLIMGLLLIFHDGISSRWPSTQSLYGLFGYEMVVPGKGLNFEGMQASAAADPAGEKISIMGKITNITDHEQPVPMIEAQMRSADGAVLERWMIRPPAQTIAAQGNIPFSTNYPYPRAGDAQSIHLRFISAKP